MQARFCGECGSELNENGLCPNCSPSEESAPKTAEKDKTQDNTKSNNNKKILLAVLSVVLVFAIIISVGIITTGKRRGERQTATESTDSGNTDQENVQTVYVTYLNEVLIPEWGLLYADGNQANQEGIASVSLTDADKDGTEEMIVLRSKKNGESIDNIITCFEFNEQAEKNVEQTGEFIAFSDSSQYNTSNFCLGASPNTINSDNGNMASALYQVEYNSKIYCVFECITACYFEAEGIIHNETAKIYAFENGAFKEVGDLTVQYRTGVYSAKLPKELPIDNSDLAQYYAQDSVLKEICQSGKTVLHYVQYFQDSGNGVIYDKYFDNTLDAFAAFFDCWGIKKYSFFDSDNPEDVSRYIHLIIPENAKPINTYAAWIDGNRIKTEIRDYTDLQGLLNNETTTAAVTKSPETTIKSAAITPEEAVDIFYNNMSVWYTSSSDLYGPDEGVKYVFLDLDFDGINELAVSTTVGSELTTDNTFYKIDKATKTVKKMQSANGNNLNQLPFLVGGNELNLLKSSQDKYVYYFTGEYLPNGGAGYSQTDFGVFYCDNGKVKTEMKFWETYLAAGVIPYMGAEENGDGPFDTNTFKYGYYQGESMTETSQATYNKMKNDFLNANPKVSLSYKVIDGLSMDLGANVEKKKLLLDSYKAFSYK